ncbi:MAG: DUF983 domain-containing protein [Alphaproteobacteria bacterium]
MSILQPRCPRCHGPSLFASLLKVRPFCPQCRLAFAKYQIGDGPAYFSVLLVGLLVMSSAGMVEYKWQPPYWLQAAIWLPAILLGTVLCLRWFRTLLITVELEHGIAPEEE